MGMSQERGGSKGAGVEPARREVMVEGREVGGVQIMEDFVVMVETLGFYSECDC